MTTRTSGAVAAIRRVDSIPSMPSASRRSISTTSGRRRPARRTASSPSPLSPMTSRPGSPSTRARSPARTTAWSSTIRIRRAAPVTGPRPPERRRPMSRRARSPAPWCRGPGRCVRRACRRTRPARSRPAASPNPRPGSDGSPEAPGAKPTPSSRTSSAIVPSARRASVTSTFPARAWSRTFASSPCATRSSAAGPRRSQGLRRPGRGWASARRGRCRRRDADRTSGGGVCDRDHCDEDF